ncbi:hypothetical protein [Mesorhizobium sp.]|uniref:hypothetical protein n=1 Tax=Mesorhizobium sp. TaxID=1871066 RepID=UPI00120831DA|nr:hypothetical protein [Mesorhizobium sp.]TIV61365.1 MAG: hypothetical protein E5V80_04885 [Mesorhizobium sp.]
MSVAVGRCGRKYAAGALPFCYAVHLGLGLHVASETCFTSTRGSSLVLEIMPNGDKKLEVQNPTIEGFPEFDD